MTRRRLFGALLGVVAAPFAARKVAKPFFHAVRTVTGRFSCRILPSGLVVPANVRDYDLIAQRMFQVAEIAKAYRVEPRFLYPAMRDDLIRVRRQIRERNNRMADDETHRPEDKAIS